MSVTPIYTHAASEGVTKDVIAADFAKVFSGSADVPTPLYTLASGAASTGNTTVAASPTAIINATTTPASCKGVFVRHRGVTDTGVATTSTVSFTLGSQAAAFTLEANGAIFLPNAVSSATFTGTSSSGNVSVEYAAFT